MAYVHVVYFNIIFFFKQKTAYEMRISDWSSDVCSSDLRDIDIFARAGLGAAMERGEDRDHRLKPRIDVGVREAVGALRGQRLAIVAERSEERREGQECVSTCRFRWWAYN